MDDYGTLVFARRGETAERFALRPGAFTIGRAPDCDLALDDEAVGPQHARLLCRADGCWITDLGSATGSYLNLVRLPPDQRHSLRDGDVVRVGPFFIRYAASQPSTDAGAPTPTGRVMPPEVAARLPQATGTATMASSRFAGARRLRGNNRPPRQPATPAALDGAASNYLQYLPPRYHEVEFIGRFLLIFESVMEPLERMIGQIEDYFDPRLAPEALLPWLADWLGMALDDHLAVRQQRELIRSAAMLYLWRGTRRGLAEAIRICAGVEPIIVEPGDPEGGAELPPHVFAVVVEAPDPAAIDRALLERMIDTQKPAHTSYILDIRRADGS
jgi:phage tail-like protein